VAVAFGYVLFLILTVIIVVAALVSAWRTWRRR